MELLIAGVVGAVISLVLERFIPEGWRWIKRRRADRAQAGNFARWRQAHLDRMVSDHSMLLGRQFERTDQSGYAEQVEIIDFQPDAGNYMNLSELDTVVLRGLSTSATYTAPLRTIDPDYMERYTRRRAFGSDPMPWAKYTPVDQPGLDHIWTTSTP